jgi:hypothetical protein
VPWEQIGLQTDATEGETMKEKRKTKNRRDWEEMVRIEHEHPGLAGSRYGAYAMPLDPLTLQAAELVMPLLRSKEITYQDLWTMLDGLWALRRELHPSSAPGFVDDVPDERGTAARSGKIRVRQQRKILTSAEQATAWSAAFGGYKSPELGSLYAKGARATTRAELEAKVRRTVDKETLDVMSNPTALAAIAEHKAGRTQFGNLDDIADAVFVHNAPFTYKTQVVHSISTILVHFESTGDTTLKTIFQSGLV